MNHHNLTAPPAHPTTEIATNQVYYPTKPIKILISPGHGEGWVTNAPHRTSDQFKAWMLTYEPLINALERKPGADTPNDAMKQFHAECKTKFDLDRIMTARVIDLSVQEVAVPFEIRDHDGQERIADVSRRREIRLPPVGHEQGVAPGQSLDHGKTVCPPTRSATSLGTAAGPVPSKCTPAVAANAPKIG